MDSIEPYGHFRDRQSRLLAALHRWDPPAFILLAHGVGLSLAGETQAPLLISILTGILALSRLGITWLTPEGTDGGVKFLTAALSIALAYAVILADGGTESPFFFWILLLSGWQVLAFQRRQFYRLGAFTIAGYLVAILFAAEFEPATFFRFGLLAAFVGLLGIGRWILDRREAEVERLDDVVKAIVDDAPMAMAIFDADRETLLYANGTAHNIGIDSRDSMARLLLDNPDRPQQITTLADLVVGSAFKPSPVRTYRHIGSPDARYRIGFHPRRTRHSRPLVLIYGLDEGTDD